MLIGLTGAPGAGKATVARVLCAAGYFSAAFHDALVIEVASTWNVDPRDLTLRRALDVPLPCLAAGNGLNHDWLAHVAVNGFSLTQARSPAWLLCEWRRWRLARDPLHWLRHVNAWLATQRRAGLPHLVLTDVHSPDDAFFVRAHHGRVIRVHRPELGTPPVEAFAADADIHNTGDLAHLNAEVWRVVGPMTAHLTGA